MAVYKVIQDIEAEDKLLGPLTLKSFIYAAIAGLLAFINVRLLIAGGPIYLKLIIILILLFPMLLFGVLASPLGRDQPTEVWLLSHVRFLLKPRQRIWDQSGINNLVTITVPKRITHELTDGLSQTEVQSRLQALATTMDSRGWAVKNSSVSLGGKPGYLDESGGDSDRLIGTSSLPQQVAVVDVHPADDIMDEENNVTAQHFNQLMQQADSQRKKVVAEKINAARQTDADGLKTVDSSFIDSAQKDSSNTMFVGRTVVAPHNEDDSNYQTESSDTKLSAEAEALLQRQHKREEEIHRRSASFKPKTQIDREAAQAAAAKKQAEEDNLRQATVTAAQSAAKLELAQSGNDLSVASIAHLANRTGQFEQISPNEGVISLH